MPAFSSFCQAAAPAAAIVSDTARGAALVARYATSTAAASTLPLDGPALTVRTRVVVPYHPTSHGQQLVLVGSCEELGNWDPKKGESELWRRVFEKRRKRRNRNRVPKSTAGASTALVIS
jgi:hypothetical protein